MTRREELEEKANQFLAGGKRFNAVDLSRLLAQVERACWLRAEEKIEQLMEKENESTDDQIWEYRDWCRAQKEGV